MKHESWSIFLTLVLMVSLLRPCSCDIRYRSGSQHASVWRSAYLRLPKRWRANTVVLVEEWYAPEMKILSDSLLPENAPADLEVIGVYYDSDMQIILAEKLNAVDSERTFLHEYGHYVWYRLTTAKERHDYTRIWSKHKSIAISSYALSSVSEGFAEDFSEFNYDSQSLADIDYSMYRYFADMRDGKR